MNRSRRRVGGAQGAVVAVAVVIVTLTYLAPGDDPSLFGIDAPGGEQSGEPPKGSVGGGDANRRGSDGKSHVAGASEQALALTGPRGGANASPPPPAPRDLTPATGDAISPTDDQYIDTLGRLEAELRAGG